jgi:hypothetical protein
MASGQTERTQISVWPKTSTKSTISSLLFISLKFPVFAPLPTFSNPANTSSALLRMVDLPSFMRRWVPTYLEISATQLTLFGAPRPHHLHSKSCGTENKDSRVFSDNYFSPPQVLAFIINHSNTPFYLRWLFLRLLQDADSLYQSGPVTHITLSIYHGGLYHPLRHSGLITSVDGCVGRVGGLRQELVEISGVRASNFSQSRFNSSTVL